ncbi:peptidoglycan-binding domain-containing protein [Thermonema rossianum]|uniref:peptidoglycan-binding domain-containing protein n=1 Tax=Thermonema rossianum TaxID=55505 RepID=UPI000A008091|nr:peptidoglycan-binding domain-containing protein [Thermonema rossianum]
MKKVLFLLILIMLGTIGYNQYRQLRKFSPPNHYDYEAKTKSIDVNYYDMQAVERYFELCYEIGRFARQAWYNHGIDVRFPDESKPQSVQASLHYRQLLKEVKLLEARLIQSKELKSKGFDNRAIRYIEENGIAPQLYHAHRLLNGKTLHRGNEGEAVWYIQKLIAKQYKPIRIDGIFNQETEDAVKALQTKWNMYPSGIVDMDFVNKLLQNHDRNE